MPRPHPRVRKPAVSRRTLSHPALALTVACGLAVIMLAGVVGHAPNRPIDNRTALADRSPGPSSQGPSRQATPRGVTPRSGAPSPSSTIAGPLAPSRLPGTAPPSSVPPASSPVRPPLPPRSSAPAPPSPPSAARGAAWQRLGFYPGEGDGPAAAQKFRALEAWLGRTVPAVVSMTDTRDPQSFMSSVWGQFLQSGSRDFGSVTPRAVVSVPLSFGGLYPSAATGTAQFQAVVGGQYDSAYAYLGHALVSSGNANAIIRLGWEFDGDWMPWAAHNNPQLFVAAYRHVHDLLRSISPGFQFDFCGDAGYRWPIPRGNSHVSWDDVYPGNAYVDIVGMDVYHRSSSWSFFQQALADQLAFATAHGKPVSFPEWALAAGYGDDPAWVQNMLNWMDSLPASGPGSLAYQSWFNGDNSDGRFSLDNFGQGGAVFRSRMS
jgi:Glycosyl hydrolase family 26